MTPNIDRNEAPETWITAAPMDTLTVKGPGGIQVPGQPITMIPVLYHLYWAGADKDGTVSGFYVAVVETTTKNEQGSGPPPPLPGPKPTDYHFTTRTDSTFIFTVDGDNLITDRLHALYIYSVDDQGKPDPTPARFIFDAHDEHPPTPVIDLAYAEGDTVVLDAYGEPSQSSGRWPITQRIKTGELPKEQVPAYSRLRFFWHGEVSIPSISIVGFKYKLDQPGFTYADSNVHDATFGDPALGQPLLSPGQKVFTLRAFDQAHGAGETDRNFIMNFSPDTWWAGPDPSAWPVSTTEANTHSVDVLHWPTCKDPSLQLGGGWRLPVGSFGGTYAFNQAGDGIDSLDFRPSKRYPADYLAKGRDLTLCQRTFYEIWTDRNKVPRIFARSEGDTVHLNSWIVLWNGGYDKDSQYRPREDRATDPDLNPCGEALSGAVLDTSGRIGSPIGFRSIVITRLTPTGMRSSPAQSAMYPVWQPASVFRSPVLGGYWCMLRAGTSYALARAEDADGGIDNQVTDPVITGEDPSPDPNLRRKVLMFYVDKPPVLLRSDQQFEPKVPPDSTILFPSPASCSMSLTLVGDDVDPYDTSDPNKLPSKGEASSNTVIRFKITLYGTSLAGNDTSWTYVKADGSPYTSSIQSGQKVPVMIGPFKPGGDAPGSTNPFASGPMDISIQVCDCTNCEDLPGSGRCVLGIDPSVKDPSKPWGLSVPEPNNVIHINYNRGVGCP